jgi:LysM repeat protein
MNRRVMRVVAGVNLFAGCILLQGCGTFGKKTDQPVAQVPGGGLPPVEVQPIDSAALSPASSVETLPVELLSVQSTTPYTIQKGDTISAVAYKYNLRWQDVVAVNPGIAPTRLRDGQVIQLPGRVDLGKVRHVPATTSPRTSAPKVSAPATKTAVTAVSGPATTYVVKSGDSLSVIAARHGVKTAALREANGLKGDKIIVGQKLKIPGATKSPDASSKASAPTVTPPKNVAPKNAATAQKPAPAVAVKSKEAAPAPVAVVPPAPAPVVEPAPVKVEAVTPPPAPAVDPNVQTYAVKEGEDLYAVAIRWGVSPSDLKALNNLTATELKAGTVLKIPGLAQ